MLERRLDHARAKDAHLKRSQLGSPQVAFLVFGQDSSDSKKTRRRSRAAVRIASPTFDKRASPIRQRPCQRNRTICLLSCTLSVSG